MESLNTEILAFCKSNCPDLSKKLAEILLAKRPPRKIISINKRRLFFRAIKYDNPPSEKSMISYNPNGSALGRCNFQGESAFYCASKPEASLYELNAKPGDTFVISRWSNKGPLQVIPFGLLDMISQDSLEKTFHKIYTHSGNNYYAQSAGLSSHFLRAGFSILYPSAKYPNPSIDAENFAIPINIINNGIISPDAVVFIRVISIDIDGIKYETVKSVKEVSEILTWNQVGKWTLNGPYKSAESSVVNGEWVITADNGQVISIEHPKDEFNAWPEKI